MVGVILLVSSDHHTDKKEQWECVCLCVGGCLGEEGGLRGA